MKIGLGVAVLAAGQGTRLKLSVPKVLAPVVGRKLVDFSINEANELQKLKDIKVDIGVVVGFRRDEVVDHIKKTFSNNSNIHFATQEQQLGTADAIRSYFSAIPGAKELQYTMVICGDTPMIRACDMVLLLNHLENTKSNGVAATFNTENPTGYGRIIRGKQGFSIIEEKDASIEQKKIKEVNSGFYILRTDYLLEALVNVNTNNKSKEYYLTDVFKDNKNVEALLFPNSDTFVGVNTLAQLSYVEQLLLDEKVSKLQAGGVHIIKPTTSYFEYDVEVAEGTVIYQNVSLKGKTKVAKNCVLEEGCIINNSVIGENCEIKSYSVIDQSTIFSSVSVGPFARLRPKTVLESEVKVGNFVEIKKATMRHGSKASHLTYIGDADIGERTNIGCGFITCNYDGANKHFTKIGKDSFIGSDTQVVAPINIGNECFVASGSTITQDMPDGAFAISRLKQTTKEGMAKKFIKKKN